MEWLLGNLNCAGKAPFRLCLIFMASKVGQERDSGDRENRSGLLSSNSTNAGGSKRLSNWESRGSCGDPGVNARRCLIRKCCKACKHKNFKLPEACSKISCNPGRKRKGASATHVARRQNNLDAAFLPEIGIADWGGNGEAGRKLERDLALIQAALSASETGQFEITLFKSKSCACADSLCDI